MSLNRMTLIELTEYLAGRERLSFDEVKQLRSDPRRGARHLLRWHLLRRRRRQRELARLHMMLAEERIFWNKGIELIAGVDEAGRGPLAGPVVAAAVILPRETVFPGLDDSKKLSAALRDRLDPQIRREALGVGIGIGAQEDIDRLNIHWATMEAMRQALHALPCKPEVILVDGFPIRGLAFSQKAIKGGDALSLSIAAASVVAKVTRDRIMDDLHIAYPVYGFDRNKGYASPEHRRALARFGPCPAHRRSFRLDYAEREEDGGCQ